MTSGCAAGRLGPWSRPEAPLPGLAALIGAAVAADAIAPISGHILAAVQGGDARVLPARDESGTDLVGIAVALAGDPAEVVVAPDHRGRGLGTALVRAAVDGQGAVWAYGDLPAARVVAARLDLRPTRVLLQMRRVLPIEPTAAPPPAGVRLRTFEPGRDEAAFLGVNARAFATHPEQGRLDLTGLRDEMAQDWFDPSGFFLAVADPGEEILGFHWTKVHPHDESVAGPIGEIYVLGVDPQAQVRGLGGVLADAGLRHLADRGLRTVMLYVEQDNARAVRLYERFGFTVHRSNVVYRPSGA
ncbi:MAG TPA: mycothiol synthase [Nakamurella sp.]